MRPSATAIDLFAGCGGMSLGLQQAGLDVRAAVEMDPTAAKRYKNIVGIQPIVSDICTVSGTRLLRTARLLPGQCFLLTACAPCQGFSSQRPPKHGAADPRNGLIHEAVRLVAAVRPMYVMLENVPGLAVGVGAPIYHTAVSRLNKLGYVRMDERVVDAADYGVPQRRQRLIVLFRRRDMPDIKLPAATHVNPQLADTEGRPIWRSVREAIGCLRPLAPGEVDPNDPLHAASAHRPDIVKRIEAIPSDGGSRAVLPTELTLECHRNHSGHRDVYGRMRWDAPAPTLTGGCHKPSKGRFIHPEQDRGITLREAALLQAFPPDTQFAGSREQIAEQIGNAVPPALAAALARPIATMWKEAHDEVDQHAG